VQAFQTVAKVLSNDFTVLTFDMSGFFRSDPILHAYRCANSFALELDDPAPEDCNAERSAHLRPIQLNTVEPDCESIRWNRRHGFGKAMEEQHGHQKTRWSCSRSWSRGLGAALARRFAGAYSVAILARKGDYLKELAAELRQGGGTALDLICDVGNDAQISEAFHAIRAKLGEVELLMYNAGTGVFGSITEITPDQYVSDWRVNAFGICRSTLRSSNSDLTIARKPIFSAKR
jgi:hypothetical protein